MHFGICRPSLCISVRGLCVDHKIPFEAAVSHVLPASSCGQPRVNTHRPDLGRACRFTMSWLREEDEEEDTDVLLKGLYKQPWFTVWLVLFSFFFLPR